MGVDIERISPGDGKRMLDSFSSIYFLFHFLPKYTKDIKKETKEGRNNKTKKKQSNWL